MIPVKKPFFISKENKIQLGKILSVRARHPVNILVKGRHGMGKSECARQIAANWSLDYYPIPIG